jgi:hypothetical protein
MFAALMLGIDGYAVFLFTCEGKKFDLKLIEKTLAKEPYTRLVGLLHVENCPPGTDALPRIPEIP